MKVSGQVCGQDLTVQNGWLVLSDQKRLLEGNNVIAAQKEDLGIGLAEDMGKRLGCSVEQSWCHVRRKSGLSRAAMGTEGLDLAGSHMPLCSLMPCRRQAPPLLCLQD